MSRHWPIAGLLLLWALVTMLTASAIFADLAVMTFPNHREDYAKCRRDMAFAIGWSMLPPAWVVAPFATGFYVHGFAWPWCPRARSRSAITGRCPHETCRGETYERFE
jgi:hypothetical protein